MTAVAAAEGTRLERRKARTRRKLIDAARQLLAERGTTDVSIQDITELADVGFGSFYNHFETKAELFEVAAKEVLEEHGAAVDAACAGLRDSAEIYAVGVRMTAHLAQAQPAVAQVLVQVGFDYAWSEEGLAWRAMRDLRRGFEAGRFTATGPELGMLATAGCLLAFLTRALEAPDELRDADADALAEMLLRMLGMSARSAAAVAHRPLPPT
jgi:AcrR family transcriptional regulator